uniref:Uncharacterized protein n=1 Tax=Roseihalotalea indica TaxID=2867963 RepID=A0AA49GG55_9BACT|nr:hypothetical protein K4G66_16795 [Tunicatimonas sp. TK19036]
MMRPPDRWSDLSGLENSLFAGFDTKTTEQNAPLVPGFIQKSRFQSPPSIVCFRFTFILSPDLTCSTSLLSNIEC